MDHDGQATVPLHSHIEGAGDCSDNKAPPTERSIQPEALPNISTQDGSSEADEGADDDYSPLAKALQRLPDGNAIYDSDDVDRETAFQMPLVRRLLAQSDESASDETASVHDSLSELLAIQLREEDKAMEENEMMSTAQGKALKFVQAVLELHDSLKRTGEAEASNPGDISTVATDDLVWLTERMLVKQEEMNADKKNCCQVDLGYHYTQHENLHRIRTDGLLTRRERTDGGIQSNYNGSTYGDGIYTCDEPTKYRHRFGPVGLLVARLKGQTTANREVTDMTYAHRSLVVLRSSAQCVPLILYSCEPSDLLFQYHYKLQVLVDIYFNDGAVTKVSAGKVRALAPSKQRPQTVLYDAATVVRSPRPTTVPTALPKAPANPQSADMETPIIGLPAAAGSGATIHDTINHFPRTQAPPPLPWRRPELTHSGLLAAAGTHSSPSYRAWSFADFRPRRRRNACLTSQPVVLITHGPQPAFFAASSNAKIYYEAPFSFHSKVLLENIVVPPASDDELAPTDACAICLNSLGEGARRQIRVCGHQFHHKCIIAATMGSNRCPLCGSLLDEPRGSMPSGEMTVQRRPALRCAGFERGSIEIQYKIYDGTQKGYHSNPRARFKGTERTAFLPDNSEGKQLLKRLQYAFSHGLTFTVGTSLTNNLPNCVTWASIHHKTSPSGGRHGFPDSDYFENCNAELDALGIPRLD